MRLVRYTYPNTRALSPVYGTSFRNPWSGLEGEIDRLFGSALSNFVGAAAASDRFPVDLYDDKDNTYVRAELPGVDRADINVEMVEDYLTITAARKTKDGESEESFSFSRSVTIPSAVQGDKVSAAYENGVLTVTLPKQEETKSRKISVNVS
jgi:HSP20 family protein